MKKLGKMKLNEFSKTELDQRKMNALTGGCNCFCGCVCAGDGDYADELSNKSGSKNQYSSPRY